MNKVLFTGDSWEHYLYWQIENKKIAKRINDLIKDISRNSNDGIGKPEPLKGNLSGWWSRRIDESNRLVYRLNNGVVEILQCKGHYKDK
jgi:toxin YoeB